MEAAHVEGSLRPKKRSKAFKDQFHILSLPFPAPVIRVAGEIWGIELDTGGLWGKAFGDVGLVPCLPERGQEHEIKIAYVFIQRWSAMHVACKDNLHSSAPTAF